jgi:hypothetical protein
MCLAALAAAAAVPVAAWALRNWVQLGRPILTTTHGGYTLWLANNDDYYDFLRSGSWGEVWTSKSLDQQQSELARKTGFDEVAADRAAYERARAAIARQPMMFAWSCLVRLGQLWNPLPHKVAADESLARAAGRWMTAAWYTALYCLAAIGLYRLGRSAWTPPWSFALGLVAAFCCVHALYWSNLRMRAPLVPVLAWLAAYGWTRGLRRRDVA